MNNMIGIYKITNPNDKIYIGQSVNIEKRLKNYKNLNNCKKQHLLYRSLDKYGYENHIFEIIEECNIEILNERERYWQEFYDVLNKGLNLKLTSFNDRSGVLSEKIKNKISLSRKNNKHLKEVYKKISETMKGFKHSKETCEKMSKSRKGLKYNTNRTLIKTIYQYDLNMNLIKIWDSFVDISKEYPKNKNSIWYCLINKQKTCLKFYWSYSEI